LFSEERLRGRISEQKKKSVHTKEVADLVQLCKEERQGKALSPEGEKKKRRFPLSSREKWDGGDGHHHVPALSIVKRKKKKNSLPSGTIFHRKKGVGLGISPPAKKKERRLPNIGNKKREISPGP